MVTIIDPTTVTNPPRGTDPAELAEFSAAVAAGSFAGNGETYAEKSEAVNAARKIVRGIAWVSNGAVRATARYITAPDGSISFYVKARAANDSDED